VFCRHDAPPLGAAADFDAMTRAAAWRTLTPIPPIRPWTRRRATAALLAVLALHAAAPASGEISEIAQRRAKERKTFSDAEITDGFFKITFGAEFHVATRVDRIRKYDAPVRVYLDNRARPDRRGQVIATIADIKARIQHLDIAITEKRHEANVVVTLVRDRDLARTIGSIYGIDRARRIQTSLEPQCLSGFRKDDSFRIQHADVILVADAGEFVFFDCVYEELLQALGPINDDATVPWSMFNDNVQLGFFGVYDQYLLNMLYHPRVRPGMTRDEVAAVLPQILPEVRAWVAAVNKLPQ
jgi:hypothetical protein